MALSLRCFMCAWRCRVVVVKGKCCALLCRYDVTGAWRWYVAVTLQVRNDALAYALTLQVRDQPTRHSVESVTSMICIWMCDCE